MEIIVGSINAAERGDRYCRREVEMWVRLVIFCCIYQLCLCVSNYGQNYAVTHHVQIEDNQGSHQVVTETGKLKVTLRSVYIMT